MKDASRVSEAFLKMADYLEKHGWQRGTYGADGGPRCLIGALYSVVVEGSPWTRGNVERQLGERLGVSLELLEEWNDEQTDGPAVVAKLREIAKE